VHAFASTAATFFVPTLATCLWLFASKKLFTQSTHVVAVLYVSKVSGTQLKLVALIV
jgi:hypothetical protein